MHHNSRTCLSRISNFAILLPNEVNDFRLKKELVEKRNEVVKTNEKYRKGVDEVMSVISQDAEMMEKLNRLSKRQQRLTRLIVHILKLVIFTRTRAQFIAILALEL